ncbi:ATP-binding protein [Desulfurivibrio alkaliphilus]|uniref:Uncharacterized protein n=1 Tax=Desulfurivibrio alkaliphilus (strain DSM 19089 / UNIQEM U267 / AHT2) TaxID=589865 RepID=D6Z5G2_DESAT|nr:ATP-binding protein [Desulfurivibrio alkaliphilus]ADH86699.1 hypothetical protein DaAHT2_2022 [Desulfurivibrio alkaliphilus AHT 2]
MQIDTGQIVPPEQFVSLYNSSRLATRLDLGFHFREEELGRLSDALEAGQLVFLSGQAGVGKSRLALEVCRRFGAEHPEYEVLCVFGRNRDLWEDMQVQFRKPGRFLIFVDDANRINQFDYVVDLLQRQRSDQQIKVLATVRDYAFKKVQHVARPLGGGLEVELDPFRDEQIKKLITDEFGIKNYHYLERIASIARGNPRLAVMAAEIAKAGTLGSIQDVSALYDSYFSSVWEDLKDDCVDLRRADIMRVAAIVSFFKAVDRANEEMMKSIEGAFGITPAVFWELATHLHELELLDMFENEVVRVSDQVLGTYLFYLATFKETALDFGALLSHFFPKLRYRIVDSINPVLDAFDSERSIDSMRPHVDRVWSEYTKAGDEESFLHLLDVFGFVKCTDTLIWARDRIDELAHDPLGVPDITYEKDKNTLPSPSILSVLRSFVFAGEEDFRIALNLILDYFVKQPSKIPLLLRLLIDDYGFSVDSYLRNFEVQGAVVDALWKRVEQGDALFSRVFIAVANDYLGTSFETRTMKDSRHLLISRFDLPAIPELAVLRKSIWERLFTLYEDEALRQDVLEVISRYSTDPFRVSNSEVINDDTKHLLPFLASTLDPSSYRDCSIMHAYLDLLENNDLEVQKSLRDRYQNETYLLADILLSDWPEKRSLKLSFAEYEQYKHERLKEYTAKFSFDDYARFFEHCLDIRELPGKNRNEYLLQNGVLSALLLLAERDVDLFEQVMMHYLERQDPLQLRSPHALVQKLVERIGYERTLKLLQGADYPTKKRWLFSIHEVLPVSLVNEKVLTDLYELYETAERGDLPFGMEYLLKYIPLDSQVVTKVVATVLEKTKKEPDNAYTLMVLFEPRTEATKRLLDLLAADLDLGL